MFKRITREELAKISPWPDRIDGKTQWKKTRRTESVFEEYEGRYADLERLWKSHVENNSAASRASLPLSFIYEWNRKEIGDMNDRPDIYGPIDPDCYPVSFNDGLYTSDIMLMLTFQREFVVRTVRRALGRHKVEGVVEIGCGCGPNLLWLALNFPGLSLSGCELSRSAVALVNRITIDTDLPIRSRVADFSHDCIADLANSDQWALLSVHAIEQTPGVDLRWLESLLRNRPPVVGIHLEPMHDGGAQPFARDCQCYAEINNYNTGFLPMMREAEKRRLIRIDECHMRVFGIQAQNPTSVLIWSPA
jgi:hypothetical protein